MRNRDVEPFYACLGVSPNTGLMSEGHASKWPNNNSEARKGVVATELSGFCIFRNMSAWRGGASCNPIAVTD